MSINRKEFLEMTAAFAGSSVMASAMPWFSIFNNPPAAGMGPNDRVRIGVIGVGSRGRALLLNLQELEKQMNMEVAAVCDNYDPHYDRARLMTGENVQAFKDYRRMLEETDLDAVVIATPLHEHAQMTIDAMEAGLHVFCEKSMARYLDDVKRMYDTHLETDKILLIGHQRLFSPIYLQSMEMIRNGEIGPITMLRGWWHRNTDWVFYNNTGGRGTPLDRRLNWRFYDEYSAGMITELASHHIQVANWVLWTNPESVSGSGSINFFDDGREVYDNFALIFKYPEDIHFTYDVLQSNKQNGLQVQVLGNEGTLELESNRIYSENPSEPPAMQKLMECIEEGKNDTIPIGGATWIKNAPVRWGGEYISPDYQMNDTLLYLEGFINFIREGEAPEKLTLEGYNASIWTLLAERATKSGDWENAPREYIL